MGVRRVIFQIPALTAYLLFSAEPLISEEYSAYGVPFEVDEIETIGSSAARIKIDGRSVIVPADQLNYQIIRGAALNGELKQKTTEQILKIFEGALFIEDERTLESVSLFIFKSKDIQDNLLESVIQKLKEKSFGRNIFETLWAEHSQDFNHQVQARLILNFLEDGQTSVSNIVPGSQLEAYLWALIESRINLVIQSGGDCGKFAEFLIKAFGENSERSIQVLETCKFASEASNAEKDLDIELLKNIYGKVTNDSAKVIVEGSLSRAIHQRAKDLNEQGKYLAALKVMLDIPLNKVSPTTIDTIRIILSRSKDVFLGQEDIDSRIKFLSYFAEKSPEVSEAFSAALQLALSKAIDRQEWLLVDRILEEFNKLNKTPEGRDAFWYQAALQAVKSGSRSEGLTYYSALVNAPSWAQIFQMYIWGAFGYRWVALALFGLVVIFVKSLRKRSKNIEQTKYQNLSQKIAEPERKHSPLLPEEERDLKRSLFKLGLEGEPSEQDIKIAFRDLAKKIHPDSASAIRSDDGTATSTDEFIELTRAYDLALKLTQKRNEP
jgi:heme exporter protein D